MESVSVRCPGCGRRLFDLSLGRPPDGVVRVKCPRCRALALIDLSIYNKGKAQEQSLPVSPKASEPHS